MKKILIVNGPNLNLLGKRQPEIYGSTSLEDILRITRAQHPDLEIDDFQSNHEGALLDKIQEAGFSGQYRGIVLNAGAYTHTSLALADCIAAIPIPVIEVHISNVAAREEVRHHSFIAPVCAGSIVGLGPKVYSLAIYALK